MEHNEDEEVNPAEMLEKLLRGEMKIMAIGKKKEDPLENEQNPEKFRAHVEITDPVTLDTLRQKEELKAEGRRLLERLELMRKKHEYLHDRFFDELVTAYPKVGVFSSRGYRHYEGKIYFVGWGKRGGE